MEKRKSVRLWRDMVCCGCVCSTAQKHCQYSDREFQCWPSVKAFCVTGSAHEAARSEISCHTVGIMEFFKTDNTDQAIFRDLPMGSRFGYAGFLRSEDSGLCHLGLSKLTEYGTLHSRGSRLLWLRRSMA